MSACALPLPRRGFNQDRIASADAPGQTQRLTAPCAEIPKPFSFGNIRITPSEGQGADCGKPGEIRIAKAPRGLIVDSAKRVNRKR
jgi:hypothetical protein